MESCKRARLKHPHPHGFCFECLDLSRLKLYKIWNLMSIELKDGMEHETDNWIWILKFENWLNKLFHLLNAHNVINELLPSTGTGWWMADNLQPAQVKSKTEKENFRKLYTLTHARRPGPGWQNEKPKRKNWNSPIHSSNALFKMKDELCRRFF